MNLQAQLAFLKEQAAKGFMISGSAGTANPNERFHGKLPSHQPHQDVHNWLQSENPNMIPHQLNPSFTNNSASLGNGVMDMKSMGSYESSCFNIIPELENSISFATINEEGAHSLSSSIDDMPMNKQWTLQDADDLQSMAFGYIPHSSRGEY